VRKQVGQRNGLFSAEWFLWVVTSFCGKEERERTAGKNHELLRRKNLHEKCGTGSSGNHDEDDLGGRLHVGGDCINQLVHCLSG
jgi:hypothetical protein